MIRENRELEYGRSLGYGWYLVHQPVIIAVAYVVVRWQLAVPVKLAVLTVVSLAGTLAVTELLGRMSVMRRLLGLSPAT